MRSTQPLVALLPLFLAIACDGVSVDADAVAFRPGGYSCSVCGIGLGNSATLNGNAIPEFSLDGTANAYGVWLAGAHTVGNVGFEVTVDPDAEAFVGIDSDGGTIAGAELVGSTFSWMLSSGEAMHVTITEVATVPSWASEGAPVTVYRATYKDKNGQAASICPAASSADQWFTLIAGEIYDRTSNEVIRGLPEWVTMACMTEAAAKVKMLGYHGAGVAQATTDETDATLKMITADYCGTGESFTTSGVHVAWRDADRFVVPPFNEGALEAKWGPSGAICLDNPRYANYDDIVDHCAIPSCGGDMLYTPGVVWRTRLP